MLACGGGGGVGGGSSASRAAAVAGSWIAGWVSSPEMPISSNGLRYSVGSFAKCCDSCARGTNSSSRRPPPRSRLSTSSPRHPAALADRARERRELLRAPPSARCAARAARRARWPPSERSTSVRCSIRSLSARVRAVAEPADRRRRLRRSSGFGSVSASPRRRDRLPRRAVCSLTVKRRPCDALSGFSLSVITCSRRVALERDHHVLAEIDRRRLGLAEQALLHHVDDDGVGELVDADRLAIRLDREPERRGQPARGRDRVGLRLGAADVPRHDPLRVRQLVVIEERPQRVRARHRPRCRRRPAPRAPGRGPRSARAPAGSPASRAAASSARPPASARLFLSATMYGASALVERLLELAEPADLAVGLASRRPSRASRRSSSSVSGMNAFVHASTADVSVSMKFSSSGKGVPSP